MTDHLCANGHPMAHLGGANCGCHPDASCSLPVYSCPVCGDADYGDNPESTAIKADCADVEDCKVKSDFYAGLPAMHLTRAEFDAMDEYSATLPTGTTAGKKWKRHDGAYDLSCEKPIWIIGEYDPDDDGKSPNIKINWYIPVLRLDAPIGGAA
jgi:hypothetical protein